MYIEWSTQSAPAAHRFEKWREACTQHLYALSPERSGSDPFKGSIARRQLGSLDVTDIHCDGHLVRRLPQDISRQPGDTFYVYLQRHGKVWFEQGPRSEVAQAGDILIADPNVAFTTGTEGEFDFRLWRIDRARLAPMLALGSGELPMIKLPRQSGERALIGSWLDALLRSEQVLPSASMDTAVGTLCTLVANAAGATAQMREQGPLARRQALLQQLMRHVEQHAPDLDLSSVRLAREFSISLRTLHQLFEMSGTTFHEHLTRARLARACTLLRDPASAHLGTMEVGFASGFSEVSTFYRRFKQQNGMTPGEFRRCLEI